MAIKRSRTPLYIYPATPDRGRPRLRLHFGAIAFGLLLGAAGWVAIVLLIWGAS